MTITISNLIFCLLPDIFILYLSTKFPSMMYSRAVSAPIFSPITLCKFSENLLTNHVNCSNGCLAKMNIIKIAFWSMGWPREV